MTWPFGDLPSFGFDLIMADPPWTFELRSPKGERKAAQHHYDVMSIGEIAALPVGQLAARDSVLFLWATWPLLLDGGAAARSPVGQVMQSWGFRYVTGGSWLKRTRHGKVQMGTGYRARNACDPFLIGVAGNPATSRAARNFFEGPLREHSRKPDEAFAWCEAYLPSARRLELFSRETRPGWSSWGNEAGKFDARAA